MTRNTYNVKGWQNNQRQSHVRAHGAIWVEAGIGHQNSPSVHSSTIYSFSSLTDPNPQRQTQRDAINLPCTQIKTLKKYTRCHFISRGFASQAWSNALALVKDDRKPPYLWGLFSCRCYRQYSLFPCPAPESPPGTVALQQGQPVLQHAAQSHRVSNSSRARELQAAVKLKEK